MSCHEVVSILPAYLREETTLSATEVGKACGLKARTIGRHIRGERASPALAGLPPPLARGHGVQLRWLRIDIEEWLAARRSRRLEKRAAQDELEAWREANRRPVGRPRVRPLPDPDAPKRRVGRPTKAEQAARAAAAAQKERGAA